MNVGGCPRDDHRNASVEDVVDGHLFVFTERTPCETSCGDPLVLHSYPGPPPAGLWGPWAPNSATSVIGSRPFTSSGAQVELVP